MDLKQETERAWRARNSALAPKILAGLKSRHMEGYFAETKEEALAIALDLIPEGSVVGWGGSYTIKEIGLVDAVSRGRNIAIDRHTAKSPEETVELNRKCLLSDYYLMSANAITEDGVLVNIDGIGNRVAALCYGPKYVVIIVGMNKVVKTVADAVQRARTISAPINAMRLGANTPCARTGSCHDCLGSSICSNIVITRSNYNENRIKVILVNESLGF